MRAFCWGLREMRAEIAFGSATGAGVVAGGGVVAVPPVGDSPVVGVVGAVGAGAVVAGAVAVDDFLPRAIPAAFPDFGLAVPFDEPFTFGADAFGAFAPPLAACTEPFGPFGAASAAGTVIVAVTNDIATTIENG
jgi:hypothetical protein